MHGKAAWFQRSTGAKGAGDDMFARGGAAGGPHPRPLSQVERGEYGSCIRVVAQGL